MNKKVITTRNNEWLITKKMFPFRLSAFLCLVASLSVITTTKAQVDTSFAQYDCPNTTFNPNTTYQSNLNELISWLSSNGNYEYGYSNTTVGASTPGNSIYGAFLCRGDITAGTCRDCVSTAAQDVRRQCQFNKESVVWYSQCMVRYSNRNFFSIVNETTYILMSTVNISESQQSRFAQLLDQTMNELAQDAANGYGSTGKKFATKEANFSSVQNLYTLVQCTPDLLAADCNRCVQMSTRYLPSYSQGGRVLTPSCNLRYETYPFYTSTPAESPPELEGAV